MPQKTQISNFDTIESNNALTFDKRKLYQKYSKVSSQIKPNLS